MLHTDNPHESLTPLIHLGVAGWSIRREHADKFSQTGTHLERYASVFNAVEINSCFYRPHYFSTYERWAASGLGAKCGPILVQLPPSLAFELRRTSNQYW